MSFKEDYMSIHESSINKGAMLIESKRLLVFSKHSWILYQHIIQKYIRIYKIIYLIKSKYKIFYCIQHCLVPQNDQHFSKFMRRLNNCDFYFSKILQLFTILLQKDQLEGCLIIIASYLKRKKDIIYCKLEGIIFYIKFFVKNSSKLKKQEE